MGFLKNMLSLKRVVPLWGLLFFVQFAWSLEPQALTSELTDKANLLNASEFSQIKNQVVQLNSTGKAQLAVLIIPSLEGQVLEEYSLKVAEKTALGNDKVDNGVLLLVSVQDRKLRIEVGYGLEGALTDALSGRIIDQIIVPQFKKQSFAGGISLGVDAISKAVKGEQVAFAKSNRSNKSGGGISNALIFGLIIFAGILKVLVLKNPVLGYGLGGLVGIVVFFFLGFSLIMSLIGIPVGLLFTLFMANSRGGGYYGGGSSGGGFSGGGFSGGGGSFGGGGSSGSW